MDSTSDLSKDEDSLHLQDVDVDENALEECTDSFEQQEEQYLYKPITTYTKVADLEKLVLEGSNFSRQSKPRLPDKVCKGAYIFVVHRHVYENIKDVSYDSYSPWNSLKADGKISVPKSEKVVIGGLQGRRIRAKHPQVRVFKKQIVYLLEKDGFVVVEYIIEDDNVNLPTNEGRIFTIPSVVEKATEALLHRTTQAAAKVLNEKNVEVSKRTLTHLAPRASGVLLNKGPPPTTSIDRLLSIGKCEQSFRVECESVNGVRSVRAMKCYPESIEVFAHALPTLKDLLHFRSRVELALENDDDCSFSLNNSQYANSYGECLQYDTTFGISDLYVSVVLGSCSQFLNRESKKVVHLILGIMFHTTKEELHHAAFGKFFAEELEKVASPDQRVPCLITDGETGLRKLVQNESKIFSQSKLCACDVHLRSVVIRKFHRREGEKLCYYLFGGRKREQEDGLEVVVPGLLSASSLQQFDGLMKKLEAKAKPEIFHWVNARRDLLFEFHSRRSKSLCGSGALFRSTNILECANNRIKDAVHRKLPADQLLKTFNEIHEAELFSVKSACFGTGRYQLADTNFPCYNKEKMTKEDGLQAYKLLGVRLPYVERPPAIPDRFWKDKSEEAILNICQGLKALKCIKWPDSEQFSVKKAGSESTAFTVTRKDKIFKCSSKVCQEGCIHVVRVLMELQDSDLFESLLDRVDASKIKHRSKAANGSKDNRRGGQASKSNTIRRGIVMTTKTVFDSSYSEHDLSIDMPVAKRTRLSLNQSEDLT